MVERRSSAFSLCERGVRTEGAAAANIDCIHLGTKQTYLSSAQFPCGGRPSACDICRGLALFIICYLFLSIPPHADIFAADGGCRPSYVFAFFCFFPLHCYPYRFCGTPRLPPARCGRVSSVALIALWFFKATGNILEALGNS